MTESLFLNFHTHGSSTASFILKSKNRKCNINNLENYLPFLAEMEWNCRAIETNAKQNFQYSLLTRRKKEWRLECKYDGESVRLKLWELQPKGLDWAVPDFEWCNTPYEFRKAINGMMLTSGCFLSGGIAWGDFF